MALHSQIYLFAIIIITYKSKEKNQMTNYKPISILPAL